MKHINERKKMHTYENNIKMKSVREKKKYTNSKTSKLKPTLMYINVCVYI